MALLRVLFKRILWIIPVAFGVVTITFFTARLFNGDPTELYAPTEASTEMLEMIRADLGLDRPLSVQFLSYLGEVVRGDLGTSFSTGNPVLADLSNRLPATMELGVLGLIMAVVCGVPLGVMAAVSRERWPDFLVRIVTLIGMAIPQFWIGLILLLVFFVQLNWLPGPVGRLPLWVEMPPRVTGFLLVDTLLDGDPAKWVQALRALVLPTVTLGLCTLAPIARVTRSAMVEALQSDYIRTAYAMGHRTRVVLFRYCLRNALLPIITLIGGVIGFIFGGAVLIEAIFGWPGVGQYALQAIQQSDFVALQGFVIYASLLYVLAFLVVDILYMLIDPRMRA
ncbi:ABC transporter permease [Salipiger sp. P9]|uniref:ABC transporter permease n=1 Tax=Salipiger pentaromativorans TaxID=2943193 RepID=UPI0021571EF3|nr:ABC transporter permease [Salipiger pentaromativorans]MCR8550533.1 ABC transporter permease [Salipiger pentaromativorans]